MPNINITSKLTNHLNETVTYNGRGFYNKYLDVISYQDGSILVNVIKKDNDIMIEREHSDYCLSLLFKEGTKTETLYILKKLGADLKLEVTTNKLKITNDNIYIKYSLNLNGEDMGMFEYQISIKEETMDIKSELKKLLDKTMSKLGYEKVDVVLETPRDKKNGDYATNIAMQLAGELDQKPHEVATTIVNNIEANGIISDIQIAGPGFINFTVNKQVLFGVIEDIINLEDNYGRSKIGEKQKINVEFVSANPTGILHLGTARGAAYGDNLCRILNYAGFDVTREYYVNDAGNQINNLGLSIKARYENLCGKELKMPEDGYYGDEIKTIAEKIYNEHQDKKINEDIEYFKDLGVKTLLHIIEDDLKSFGVTFDVWTSENSIRQSGKIEECIENLKKKGNIYEKDGATWLNTSKYGDDKDRVIIKSSGEYTYLVPDIAYHMDKINRGYDALIDILGADHHGYISRLKASIEALGYPKDRINIKMLQMVKLIRNGEEVKMSKRTGKTVTIRELIEEVGVDAARYFFAMHSLDTQMEFDIDLATKKSNENPIYYVQYAHARICSILRDFNQEEKVTRFETIDSEYAYNVLTKLQEFKEVVEASALKRLPHLITNYVYELATMFHTYYAHEKILTDDFKYTNERILLIKAVKITIKNALKLIGVEAVQKM